MLEHVLEAVGIVAAAVFVLSVLVLFAGTLVELREAAIVDDEAAHAARICRASVSPWKARKRDLTADELAALRDGKWL